MLRARSPLFRLLGASLLMDGGFYFVLTVVPLMAVRIGATPIQLGLLPLIGSSVYIAASLFFGRLSDRVSRMGMARAGAWLRVLVTLSLTRADSLPWLMAALPLLAISNGLFWPALQAAVGDMGPERELSRSIGAFNISWSVGKMIGFLAGGALIAASGYDATLLVAASMALAVALVLPRAEARHSHTPATPQTAVVRPRPLPEETCRAWRRIGWTANFVLFGIGATLNFQYPKLLIERGFGERDFGVFLGIVYFFQTVSFYVLRRWNGWHFRLGPLLAAQGATLAAVLLLGWMPSRGLIWSMAPWIGLGLGLSYSSSIYYSLFRQSGAGKNTGIHEALLGTGTFLLPLAGGMAAQWSGSLITPYPLCAAFLAGVMAVEILWARGAGRSAGSVTDRGGS